MSGILYRHDGAEFVAQSILDSGAADDLAAHVVNGVTDHVDLAPKVGTATGAAIQARLDADGIAFLWGVTYLVSSQITVPAGGSIIGMGEGVSIVKAADSSTMNAIIENSANGISDVSLRGFTVDGNMDNGVTLTEGGVYMEEVANVLLQDLGARYCNGRGGLRISGNGQNNSDGARVINCHTYENENDGLLVSHSTRKTLVVGLHTHDNGQHGFWMDASEMMVDGVIAVRNGEKGVYVNNVHSSSLDNVYAMDNGHSGIYIEEMVASRGGGWLAVGNGTAGTGHAEVYLTADTDQSYGITRQIDIDGISTHTIWGNTWAGQRVCDYGLYVGDGVVEDIFLSGVNLRGAGVLGELRVPTAVGELSIRTTDGRQLVNRPPRRNLFPYDPACASSTADAAWTPLNGTLAVGVHNGMPALELTTTSGASNIALKAANRAQVNEFAYYTASAYVGFDPTSTYTLTQIRLTWYNSGGSSISSDTSAFIPSTTGFQRIHITAQAPSAATEARITVLPRVDGETGIMYVNRVALNESAAPLRYGDGDTAGWYWEGTAGASVSVEGAESDLTENFNLYSRDPGCNTAGVAALYTPINGTLVRDTDKVPHGGASCLKYNSGTGSVAHSFTLTAANVIAVTAGLWYTFSCYVSSTDYSYGQILAVFRDGATADILTAASVQTSVSAEWTRVTVTVQAPAGAVDVRVRGALRDDATGDGWFDSFQMVEAGAVTEYGDGDTVGWVWDGAAEASASHRVVDLTAADGSTVDGTYGTEEADVIENLRTRVNELETRLLGAGLLR